MKVFAILLSLAGCWSGQAVAGKRLTLLKERMSGLYADTIPVWLTTSGVAGVAVSVVYTASNPDPSTLTALALIPVGGSVLAGSYGLGGAVSMLLQKFPCKSNRARACIGKKILYRDDEGNLKSGEVDDVTNNLLEKHVKMHVVGEEAPVVFDDVIATSIPDHLDIGRIYYYYNGLPELIYRRTARIVDVFDNDVYELELLHNGERDLKHVENRNIIIMEAHGLAERLEELRTEKSHSR